MSGLNGNVGAALVVARQHLLLHARMLRCEECLRALAVVLATVDKLAKPRHRVLRTQVAS